MLRYLLLAVMLVLLMVFYILVQQPTAQFMVVVSAAALYVVWGIVHHALQKTLKLRVTLEYVMIAALAITIGYVLLATR